MTVDQANRLSGIQLDGESILHATQPGNIALHETLSENTAAEVASATGLDFAQLQIGDILFFGLSTTPDGTVTDPYPGSAEVTRHEVICVGYDERGVPLIAHASYTAGESTIEPLDAFLTRSGAMLSHATYGFFEAQKTELLNAQNYMFANNLAARPEDLTAIDREIYDTLNIVTPDAPPVTPQIESPSVETSREKPPHTENPKNINENGRDAAIGNAEDLAENNAQKTDATPNAILPSDLPALRQTIVGSWGINPQSTYEQTILDIMLYGGKIAGLDFEGAINTYDQVIERIEALESIDGLFWNQDVHFAAIREAIQGLEIELTDVTDIQNPSHTPDNAILTPETRGI